MLSSPTARETVLPRPVLLLGLALSLACVPPLLRLVCALPVVASFDFNEGWNALQVAALESDAGLYAPPGNLFDNNYPPLSFHLVQSLGPLVPDHVVAGRLLALLAFLALGLLSAWAVARRAGLAAGGLTMALLFAVFLALSHYPGINDPQMLGHALAAAGLLFLFRSGEPDARDVIGAAFWFVLAGFVKHNLLVLPLATLVWLLLCHRRLAPAFVIAGAAFVLLGWTLVALQYGTGWMSHLLQPRVYSLAVSASAGKHWLSQVAVPLLALGIAVLRWRQDRLLVFCGLYALAGALTGVWFAGGAGVDQNVFFDLYIALALAGGLAAARLTSRRDAVLFAAIWLLPLGTALLGAADRQWLGAGHWIEPHRDDAAAARPMIELLRRTPGEAICSDLALCYWAGKRRAVDPFGVGQRMLTGGLPADTLERLVAARRFAAIQGDGWPQSERLYRVAAAAGYRQAPLPAGGVLWVAAAD
jgi:hypothetical protein